MSLPTEIPLQSVPFAHTSTDGTIYVEFNWYLFLYNLAFTVFGPNGTPIPPSVQITLTDDDAISTDSIQAYRQIANMAALEAQDMELTGADVADLRRRITNMQALIPDQDVTASLRDLANAILLAADAVLPDPPPKAGAVIPLTPGSSPFTYKAIHDGTMFISGSVSSTLALSRYGVNVPMGMSDGTIPMRENDQLTVTWSGGTPPTMNFLPNQ